MRRPGQLREPAVERKTPKEPGSELIDPELLTVYFTELEKTPEMRRFLRTFSPEPEDLSVKLRGFMASMNFERPNYAPKVHGKFVSLNKFKSSIKFFTDEIKPTEKPRGLDAPPDFTWSQFDLDFFTPKSESGTENPPKLPEDLSYPRKHPDDSLITKQTIELQFERILRTTTTTYSVTFFDIPEKIYPEIGKRSEIVQPLVDPRTPQDPELEKLRPHFDKVISFKVLTKPLIPKRDVVIPKNLYKKLMTMPKENVDKIMTPKEFSPFLKELDSEFKKEEPENILEQYPLKYSFNYITQSTDFYVLHHPKISTFKGSLVTDYEFGKVVECEAKWARPMELTVQSRKTRVAKSIPSRKPKRHTVKVTEVSVALASIAKEPEPLLEFQTSEPEFAMILDTENQLQSEAPGFGLPDFYDGFGVEKTLIGSLRVDPLEKTKPKAENAKLIKIKPDLNSATVHVSKLISKQKNSDEEFNERTVPIQGSRIREQAFGDHVKPAVAKNQVITTEIYQGSGWLAEEKPNLRCEEILPAIEEYPFYETIPESGLCSAPINLFNDESRIAVPFEATLKLEETMPLHLMVDEYTFAMLIEETRPVENAPVIPFDDLAKDCFVEPKEFGFTWIKPETFKPEKEPVRVSLVHQKPVDLHCRRYEISTRARNADNQEHLLSAIPVTPKQKIVEHCKEVLYKPANLNEVSVREITLQGITIVDQMSEVTFKDEPFTVAPTYATQSDLEMPGYGPKDFSVHLFSIFRANARPEEFSRCKTVQIPTDKFASLDEDAYAFEEETDATLQTNPGIFKPQIYGIDDDDWWEGYDKQLKIIQLKENEVSGGNSLSRNCPVRGNRNERLKWLWKKATLRIKTISAFKKPITKGMLMYMEKTFYDMGFDSPSKGGWDSVDSASGSSEPQLDPSRPPSEPMFLVKPTDDIFFTGKTIRVEVEVSGNPRPTVSWLKEKLTIVENERITFGRDDSSNRHWMVIRDASVTDEASYCVTLSSSISPLPTQCSFDLMAVDEGLTQMVKESRQISRASLSRASMSRSDIPGSRMGLQSGGTSRADDTLIEEEDLGEPRAPEFDDELNDMSVKVGKNCKMGCEVSGNPIPVVSWRKDGRPIKAGGRITIQHKSDGECSLRISKVTREDQGDYICEATNKFGKLITEARLTVKS
ncbi:titin-like [Symsagittifera roscoffensis]|uniref:titin-like n=1 Tax=Symsagittifera roscoffensis TaxID=84072 RepID=UPI00307C2597